MNRAESQQNENLLADFHVNLTAYAFAPKDIFNKPGSIEREPGCPAINIPTRS